MYILILNIFNLCFGSTCRNIVRGFLDSLHNGSVVLSYVCFVCVCSICVLVFYLWCGCYSYLVFILNSNMWLTLDSSMWLTLDASMGYSYLVLVLDSSVEYDYVVYSYIVPVKYYATQTGSNQLHMQKVVYNRLNKQSLFDTIPHNYSIPKRLLVDGHTPFQDPTNLNLPVQGTTMFMPSKLCSINAKVNCGSNLNNIYHGLNYDGGLGGMYHDVPMAIRYPGYNPSFNGTVRLINPTLFKSSNNELPFIKGRPFVDAVMEARNNILLNTNSSFMVSPVFSITNTNAKQIWYRSHWYDLLLDPGLVLILFQVAQQQAIISRNIILGKSHLNDTLGYKIMVTCTGGGTKPVWICNLAMEWLVGFVLTDGGIVKVNNSHNYQFSMGMGPSNLGMQLTVFAAALCEVLGIAKGHITIYDHLQKRTPASVIKSIYESEDLYLGNCVTHFMDCVLSHQIFFNSGANPIWTALHKLFYAPNPMYKGTPGESKFIKCLDSSFDLSKYFKLTALAFAILGDGSSEGKAHYVNREGFSVQDRYRLYLGIYSMPSLQRQLLVDHITNVMKYQCSIVSRSAGVGNNNTTKVGNSICFLSDAYLTLSKDLFSSHLIPAAGMYKLHTDMPRNDVYHALSGLSVVSALNFYWANVGMPGNPNSLWTEVPTWNDMLVLFGKEMVPYGSDLYLLEPRNRCHLYGWHPLYSISTRAYIGALYYR